jgi:hypothetical protein
MDPQNFGIGIYFKYVIMDVWGFIKFIFARRAKIQIALRAIYFCPPPF